MRKILPFLLAGLGLAALLLFYLNANQEKRYPEATFALLNEAETQWYNAGIQHYRLVVEVEFSTERRRHAIQVQNGEVVEATLSYWEQGSWSEPGQMNLAESLQYTVPGLFTSLRQELNLNFREEIRVDMNAEPSYPRHIYFGLVWQDGEPMAESEARISVPEFELLPGAVP
jgi:hypothetical protein